MNLNNFNTNISFPLLELFFSYSFTLSFIGSDQKENRDMLNQTPNDYPLSIGGCETVDLELGPGYCFLRDSGVILVHTVWRDIVFGSRVGL